MTRELLTSHLFGLAPGLAPVALSPVLTCFPVLAPICIHFSSRLTSHARMSDLVLFDVLSCFPGSRQVDEGIACIPS